MNTYEIIKKIIFILKPVNIALNISDFVSILEFGSEEFDPTTELDILRTGFYGILFETKVWVSKNVKEETLWINNQDIDKFSDGKWSDLVCFDWISNGDINISDHIDRMQKLKAFW